MNVAIAGTGYSEIGRDLDRTAADLTAEAARNALDDAGLDASAVDGIATYAAGDSIHCFTLADALGLKTLDWFADLNGLLPAAVAPVVAAADAVAAGKCTVAIAYRSVKRNRTRAPGLGFSGRVGGESQWRSPFGDSMTSQWLAMWARRHMHEFGTTEEHLGRIAVTFRDHAALNPRAPLREPITLDDYFANQIVTTPFRRLDCDFPVDGAGAVVITTTDRANDMRQKPIRIVSSAVASGERPDWEQWPDMTAMASRNVAEQLWSRSGGMTPKEVNVAQVYDGFSWLALCWLEDLGFCAKGDGGPFIAEGNIALGGRLPTNTHGGSLSGGRLHAISHVIECVGQLRGECGARQVPKARTGVVAAGGGPTAGAILLQG